MPDEDCRREMKELNKFTSSVDSVRELIFVIFTALREYLEGEGESMARGPETLLEAHCGSTPNLNT